jgi:F-type H+-transporting ATPase subunit b
MSALFLLAAEAAAGAAGAGEPASAGLPQFDLAKWPGQMVWMLIIFGFMLFLFARVFVPRVGGTIADREDRIAGDIGDARRLKEQADQQAAVAASEMGAARSAAHKLAIDAKAKANADTAAQEAVEEARLNETLLKAEVRIGAARDQAMTHVRGIASETAQAIVAHLTGREASADEVKSALAGQA